MAKFKTIQVDAPNHDFDLVITWPNGEEVTIQARPSNADIGYEGKACSWASPHSHRQATRYGTALRSRLTVPRRT